MLSRWGWGWKVQGTGVVEAREKVQHHTLTQETNLLKPSRFFISFLLYSTRSSVSPRLFLLSFSPSPFAFALSQYTYMQWGWENEVFEVWVFFFLLIKHSGANPHIISSKKKTCLGWFIGRIEKREGEKPVKLRDR